MAVVLSENAARELKHFVREVRGGPGGLPPENASFDPFFAPELYVAKSPSNGIPARSGSTMGHAICNLYRANPTTHELEVMTNRQGNNVTKDVHNITTLKVLGDKFIIITRSKSGCWLVIVEECI